MDSELKRALLEWGKHIYSKRELTAVEALAIVSPLGEFTRSHLPAPASQISAQNSVQASAAVPVQASASAANPASISYVPANPQYRPALDDPTLVEALKKLRTKDKPSRATEPKAASPYGHPVAPVENRPPAPSVTSADDDDSASSRFETAYERIPAVQASFKPRSRILRSTLPSK